MESPNGVKHQLVMDQPIRAKRVGILIHRQRYHCRACSRTFFEPLKDVDEHHFMTERLVNYIQCEALRRTFTSIADDVGLDEWTIRSLFRESTAHLSGKAIEEPVTILGIDEVYLLHKPRCVLTDIERRRIVDLLRTRDKDSVKNYYVCQPRSEQGSLAFAWTCGNPTSKPVTTCCHRQSSLWITSISSSLPIPAWTRYARNCVQASLTPKDAA